MKSLHKLYGPVGSIAIQASGLGLGLISSVLLARLLGSDGFGIYGFAYSIVSLIAIPLHTGLAMLLVKELTRFRAQQDHSRTCGIIMAANRTVIAFSVVAAAGIACWVMSAWGRGEGKYLPTLVVAILLLPAISFGSIRGGVLRGLEKPIMGQLPDSIIRPAILVLALAVAWLSKYKISPSLAMGLHVGAALVGTTFGLIVIRQVMPIKVWKATPIYEWRAWSRALLPLSAVAGIQALSASIATIALAAHRAPAEIAYYRVAELGASVVAMPLGAVAVFAAGRIAHLFSSGDKISLREDLRHFARIVFLFACVLSLPMLFFGDVLLGWVFGSQYVAAWFPLIILCVAQIASAAVGLVGVVMTMAGKYRETVIALIAALVLQAILTLVLTPQLGGVGASIASGVGVIVWSQILFWRARYLLSISTFFI